MKSITNPYKSVRQPRSQQSSKFFRRVWNWPASGSKSPRIVAIEPCDRGAQHRPGKLGALASIRAEAGLDVPANGKQPT
jgi:hypothetical protein